MATKNDSTAGPTPDDAAQPAVETTAAPVAAAAVPQAAPRSGVPKALAITGAAVGAALLLGLTFAGGVAVGHVLPDGRGPGGLSAMGPMGDRRDAIEERIGDRIDQRINDRIDERMEQRMDERMNEPADR